MVTGSAEAVPHFENGEVWISPYWSARSGYYIDRGLPFDMVVPEEGVIGLFDCACVPVGAKNKKLAYEFLNFRLDPAVAARMVRSRISAARAAATSPTGRRSSRDTQIVTKEQIAKVQFPDSEVIGAAPQGLDAAWQEIMALGDAGMRS